MQFFVQGRERVVGRDARSFSFVDVAPGEAAVQKVSFEQRFRELKMLEFVFFRFEVSLFPTEAGCRGESG